MIVVVSVIVVPCCFFVLFGLAKLDLGFIWHVNVIFANKINFK